MRKLIVILTFVQASIIQGLLAQFQNLVPNPSFESFPSCSEAFCGNDWCDLKGSVDVLTFCDTPSFYWNGYIYMGYINNAPQNWNGYQTPHSGNNYAGFAVYGCPFTNAMEIPQVKLQTKLQNNCRYFFEFYLSLSDSSWYGSKNIGVCFYDSLKLANSAQIFNGGFNMSLFEATFQPQWIYSGPYLNDKSNWSKIAGSFISNGTEEYMAIGNFCGDNCLDTIITSPISNKPTFGNPGCPFYKIVYYYIDDISLFKDTTYIGIEEPDYFQSQFFVSDDNLNVNLSNNSFPSIFVLFDATGRQVFTKVLEQRENRLMMPPLSQGVYSYGLIYKGKVMKHGKFVF